MRMTGVVAGSQASMHDRLVRSAKLGWFALESVNDQLVLDYVSGMGLLKCAKLPRELVFKVLKEIKRPGSYGDSDRNPIAPKSNESVTTDQIAMLEVWQKMCDKTCRYVRGRNLAQVFRELPDTALYPDYCDIIEKPMCFSIIKKKIENSSYKNWAAFEMDIMLMFANARKYNMPGSQVCLDAKALEKTYHSCSAVRDRRAPSPTRVAVRHPKVPAAGSNAAASVRPQTGQDRPKADREKKIRKVVAIHKNGTLQPAVVVQHQVRCRSGVSKSRMCVHNGF
jgi:hypothetical protein